MSEEIISKLSQLNIKAGAIANKNGLEHEILTDLKTEYNIIKKEKYYNIIKFKNHEKLFKTTKNPFKVLKNKDIIKAHGCKKPDECFYLEDETSLFIIEKKFQNTTGSVCEKIQSPDFKIWQYSRTFQEYEIIYIYCLSSWFRENCKAELEYLKYKNIPVFFSDENYKEKIINFMVNY